MSERVRILCLGDVVGRPGRRALRERLPRLRADLGADLIIVNGENASGGVGLTPESMRELFAAGADLITSGNHIWKHKEIFPALRAEPRLLRPYNYGDKVPGRGWTVVAGGLRVGVLNLLGRVFMDPVDCPFAGADRALAAMTAECVSAQVSEGACDTASASADACEPSGGRLSEAPLCIIVDFHAEASSEKRAMAHYLDGRVSAVLGTHTHVQTADAFVSASGTASLTDLGMCGVEEDSVIGMAKEKVLRRFTTGLPQPFIPAKGEAALNGALVEVDKNTGKALSIRLVRDKAFPFIDSRG